MRRTPRRGNRVATVLLLYGGVLGIRPAPAQQPADTLDQPISLENQPEDLGEIDRFPLHITGFGVGNYSYAGRTGENSFSASKVAVGLFREITSRAYLFGQLTTALEEPVGGGEPSTDVEIDNLLFSVVPPGASNVALNFGKIDLPVGFERDDEPLNFLVSPSFNFELARPVKMVGLEGTWRPSPRTGLEAFLFNGWDTDLDPNHGKTGGVRLEFLPWQGATLGLSGLYGVEGDQGATNNRYLLNVDYAVQPSWDWVVAGEASLGGDRGVLPGGSDATWRGGMVTLFHRFTRHWGAAARAEVFRDADGVRTGVTQTLESYTIAPLYSLGVGREGIFANVQNTTVRIPRLQLRGEVRFNHSNVPFFLDRRRTGHVERGVPAPARHDLLSRSYGPLSVARRAPLGQTGGRALPARAGLRLYVRLPDGQDLERTHARRRCRRPTFLRRRWTWARCPSTRPARSMPLDLGTVPEMKHTVDTNLLIQDSHIHIMIYAIVAALESLIIFGLGWPGWFRDSMIVGAFGFGALDFAGQWLMKANLPGFAWLTLLSGWGMALVYLIVLGGTLRAIAPRRTA